MICCALVRFVCGVEWLGVVWGDADRLMRVEECCIGVWSAPVPFDLLRPGPAGSVVVWCGGVCYGLV